MRLYPQLNKQQLIKINKNRDAYNCSSCTKFLKGIPPICAPITVPVDNAPQGTASKLTSPIDAAFIGLNPKAIKMGATIINAIPKPLVDSKSGESPITNRMTCKI